MSWVRLVHRLRRLRPGMADDTGSLPMAMLVIMIGLALGATLLPMLITQDRTTRFDTSRVHELHAAEAGFDVALGQIRASGGVSTGLPCGPLSGTTDGTTGGSYTVTIAYYTQNPAGQTAAWLASYSAGGNQMLCQPGYGTYLPGATTGTGQAVPSFVLLTSTGTDGSGGNGASTGRTLQTTYVVQTDNTNIAGGTISIYPNATAGPMCMDAGSATPAAGTIVLLEQCSKPIIAQQAWSYNSDLSIQLVSSVTPTVPNGMCLDAGTPHAVGKTMVMEPCSAGGDATYNQQWSINDQSDLEGAKSDDSDVDGFCVYAATQTAGQQLTLATCAGGVTDTTMTWVPSPNVGAGMAGPSDNQVVNFQQFGRCMDVTNTDVTSAFLIAYPCKQDPNPSKVLWNQKFTYNSNDEWVTNNGSNYCLKSPLASYVGGPSGPYVTVALCPSGKPTAASGMLWTNFSTQDSKGNQLPYSQRYTVVDSNGLCLGLGTDSSDYYNGQYAKVIVSTCDGSTDQKWNAEPDLQVPLLQNTSEK